METQSWIIGQIIIDIFMAALLLWFIRYRTKGKGADNNLGRVFERSEKILSEMRELSRQLDKNLEEKRMLSRKILGQLDEGMHRADEAYRQFQDIIRDYGHDRCPIPDPLADSSRIKSSVKALLERGLSREEVAQHLGISVGEIELLIKLQPQAEESGTQEGK